MRVKVLLSVFSLSCSLMASTLLGDPVTVPGTKLTLDIDNSLQDKGDALKDMESSVADVLDAAREYSFESKSGVFGSVMTYRPKPEFADMSDQWCDMMAEGIEDAVHEQGKVKQHDIGNFGEREAHFITMDLVEGTVHCATDFVVIGGRGEIILLAVSVDSKDAEACTAQKKIVDSLKYDGLSLTGRKSASQPKSADTPKPDALMLQRR